MSKLKKSKKKYKGVRYIARVLQKYGGKKYKGNYKNALNKSREVLSTLQQKGQKVKVSNILDVTRKKRNIPKLFYKLAKPEPYFRLIQYPTYIKDTTKEITFISEVFNLGTLSVEGGEKPNYNDTFSSFVNFSNKEMGAEGKNSSDEITIYVVCTQPLKDKNNKWVSKIITVDPKGDPYDFGFKPSLEPTKGLPQQQPGKQQAIPKEIKSEKVRQKELELKIEKEKSRQLAMQLFLNKDITKLEYKEMIQQINKK